MLNIIVKVFLKIKEKCDIDDILSGIHVKSTAGQNEVDIIPQKSVKTPFFEAPSSEQHNNFFANC